MSGEYDFIACGGYCPGILDQKTAAVFPASKDLDVYVQPNTGHAINFGVRTQFFTPLIICPMDKLLIGYRTGTVECHWSF